MAVLFDDSLASVSARLAAATRVAVCSDAEGGDRLSRTLAMVLGEGRRDVLAATSTRVALKSVLFPVVPGTMVVYESRGGANAAVEFLRALRARERANRVENPHLVMVLSGESAPVDRKLFRGGPAKLADVVVSGPCRLEGFLDAALAVLLGSRPPLRAPPGPTSLHTPYSPGEEMRKPRLLANAYRVRGEVTKIRARLTAIRRFKPRKNRRKAAAADIRRPSLLELVQAQASASQKAASPTEKGEKSAATNVEKAAAAAARAERRKVRLSLPGASAGQVRAMLNLGLAICESPAKPGQADSASTSSASYSDDDEDFDFVPGQWHPGQLHGDDARRKSLRSDIISSMNKTLEICPETTKDPAVRAVFALKRRETRKQSLVRKADAPHMDFSGPPPGYEPRHQPRRPTPTDEQRAAANAAADARRSPPKARASAPPSADPSRPPSPESESEVDELLGDLVDSSDSETERGNRRASVVRAAAAAPPPEARRSSLADLFGIQRRKPTAVGKVAASAASAARATGASAGPAGQRGSFSMLPPARNDLGGHRGSVGAIDPSLIATMNQARRTSLRNSRDDDRPGKQPRRGSLARASPAPDGGSPAAAAPRRGSLARAPADGGGQPRPPGLARQSSQLPGGPPQPQQRRGSLARGSSFLDASPASLAQAAPGPRGLGRHDSFREDASPIARGMARTNSFLDAKRGSRPTPSGLVRASSYLEKSPSSALEPSPVAGARSMGGRQGSFRDAPAALGPRGLARTNSQLARAASFLGGGASGGPSKRRVSLVREGSFLEESGLDAAASRRPGLGRQGSFLDVGSKAQMARQGSLLEPSPAIRRRVSLVPEEGASAAVLSPSPPPRRGSVVERQASYLESPRAPARASLVRAGSFLEGGGNKAPARPPGDPADGGAGPRRGSLLRAGSFLEGGRVSLAATPSLSVAGNQKAPITQRRGSTIQRSSRDGR